MFKKVIFSLCCIYLLTDFSFADQNEASLEENKICSSKECYTLIKKLGEGAFGNVFSVVNSKGEFFALKSYKAEAEFFGLLADVTREYQRGQTLNHPNIIKSFEMFEHKSSSNQVTNNLLLQLVEGKTLLDTDKGTLTREEAIEASMQFIQALQYALSYDFLHLDLHEGNVMLAADKAKIMIIDLASFFTSDELFGYIQDTQQESQEGSERQQNKFAANLGNPAPTNQADPIKAEKIKQFFLRNPQLFQQLKQVKQMSPKNGSRKVAALNYSVNQSPEYDHQRVLFQSYYLNSISEMAIKIIIKSDLNRDEKINLRGEIKKIVWTFEADIEEGKQASFESYSEKLLECLQSSLSPSNVN